MDARRLGAGHSLRLDARRPRSFLTLKPTTEHFADAFAQGDFARWYLNTLIVTLGILAVQLVTITLAGYAFARMEFRGKNLLFYLFLVAAHARRADS